MRADIQATPMTEDIIAPAQGRRGRSGLLGPNLVRNFQNTWQPELLWWCDTTRQRAARGVGRTAPCASPTTRRLLATRRSRRGRGHARATLKIAFDGPRRGSTSRREALASSVAKARRSWSWRRSGADTDVRHTNTATRRSAKIRDLVATGTLGEIQYIDSVRINLASSNGIDVFWDLRPMTCRSSISCCPTVATTQWLPRAIRSAPATCLGTHVPLTGGACAHPT